MRIFLLNYDNATNNNFFKLSQASSSETHAVITKSFRHDGRLTETIAYLRSFLILRSLLSRSRSLSLSLSL